MTPNEERRFSKKFMPEPNSGCWLWAGAIWQNGYGAFYLRGKNQTAHRAAYEIRHGKPIDGLEIDHLCRNRCCVNPDHLEMVSTQTNTLRGIGATAVNKRKIHCSRGHEYTSENTRLSPAGRRFCIKCKAFYNAKYKAQKRNLQ
jgi:hypothetical protein